MSFSVNLGPAVVTFLDEKNNYCTIRKAIHYLGEKPKEWNEGDFYLIVPLASRVAVKFRGGNQTVSVNDEFLELEKVFISLPTNHIRVKSENKVYNLVLHLVAEDDTCCVPEDESSGIYFEKKMMIHLFKPLSFWGNLKHKFGGKSAYDTVKESWNSFTVDGTDLITDDNPWHSEVLDGGN